MREGLWIGAYKTNSMTNWKWSDNSDFNFSIFGCNSSLLPIYENVGGTFCPDHLISENIDYYQCWGDNHFYNVFRGYYCKKPALKAYKY